LDVSYFKPFEIALQNVKNVVMASRNYMEPNKITLTLWVDQVFQNDTLVKLDMEAKKSHGGFVLLKFPVKKVMIFVVVGVIGVNGTTHALGTSKRFIMKHDVLFLVEY